MKRSYHVDEGYTVNVDFTAVRLRSSSDSASFLQSVLN